MPVPPGRPGKPPVGNGASVGMGKAPVGNTDGKPPVGNGDAGLPVGKGKPPVGKGRFAVSVGKGYAGPSVAVGISSVSVGTGTAESTSEKLGSALSCLLGKAVGASW
jgi:hypothetical protein